MGAGKVAAQCVHAALGAYRHATEAGGGALSALHIWQMTGEATIVLKVPDLQGIRAVAGAASALNVNTHAVHDAGRTQVEAGSLTCLAVPCPRGVRRAVLVAFDGQTASSEPDTEWTFLRMNISKAVYAR